MRKAAIDCLESSGKNNILSSAVVAQLVERLLSNPEIHGLHPVMEKFYLLSNVLKSALKRQMAWNGSLKKRKTRDIVILKEPNAIVVPVFDRSICRYKSFIPRYIGSRVLYQGSKELEYHSYVVEVKK